MMYIRACIVIFIVTSLCTATAAGIGAAIGKYAPDFYRAMTYNSSDKNNYDMVQIGIGYGTNSGAAFGIGISLFLVFIIDFFESRKQLSDNQVTIIKTKKEIRELELRGRVDT